MDHDDLDSIEKAVRNIVNGKNALEYKIAVIQARVVKVLMEEGVLPLQLLERGLIRPIKDIEELEVNKHGNSRDAGEHPKGQPNIEGL